MSKTHLVCHVVFGTKNRRPAITLEHRKELYNYIFGILRNNKCETIRINGMTDHIHLLFNLNPSVALSDLIKDIKQFSSRWMKGNPHFPLFEAWSKGYFAEAVSHRGVEQCRQYIINQQEHHSKSNFLDEMKYLNQTNDMEYVEADWQ